MNLFMKAIQDHTDWKVRIKEVIDGNRSAELDSDEVSGDEQCELGKWIREMDKELGHTYALSQLRDFHREFHMIAGVVVYTQWRDGAGTIDHCW